MNRMRITAPLIIICLVFGLGCQSNTETDASYESPHSSILGRDTATARRLHTEALNHIDAGEYRQAEAKLRDALDADITFAPAHNNLGKLLFDKGELYQAAWEFQYAIKLIPYQPEPRNNLGMVLEHAGKLDEAIDHYRNALQMQPDNPQLIGNLARAKHQRGDKDNEQRDLLEQLILKDTRTRWRNWAQQEVHKLAQ